MSRRLLDLRTSGGHVRVYEDAGPSLYLGLSAAPTHIVLALSAGQVDHLIDTLTGWREAQAGRRLFSAEQSAERLNVGQEGLVGRPPG